jgi:hypothetical protein
MTDNPITTWLTTLGDLPTDPTRRALTIALKAVEREREMVSSTADRFYLTEDQVQLVWPHLFAARIALTDALFPPSSVDSGGAVPLRVSDDELEQLGRGLRRSTHPKAPQLYSIVEEVMRSRAAPDRASAMRAQVLALLDGYLAVFVHALEKVPTDDVRKIIIAQQSLTAEARQQIAGLEVQP